MQVVKHVTLTCQIGSAKHCEHAFAWLASSNCHREGQIAPQAQYSKVLLWDDSPLALEAKDSVTVAQPKSYKSLVWCKACL